jgi:biotin-(acetyl-CoA carboxylase) ligase
LTGTTHDRTALLAQLLRNIELAVRDSAADPQAYGSRFQDLCLQVGQDLTIEVGGRRSTGRCAGIAPDGALLLEDAGRYERHYSGVLR